MKKEKKLPIAMIVAIILGVTTLLFAGLFMYTLFAGTAAGTELAQPKLRAYNGNVQWYDGSAWHTSTSMEALNASDPFAAEQELPTAALFSAPALTRAGGSVATATSTTSTRKPTTTTTTTNNNTSNDAPSYTPPAQAEQQTPATQPSTPSTNEGEDITWSGDFT